METQRVAKMVYQALIDSGASKGETLEDVVEGFEQAPDMLTFFLLYEKQVVAYMHNIPAGGEGDDGQVTIFGSSVI